MWATNYVIVFSIHFPAILYTITLYNVEFCVEGVKNCNSLSLTSFPLINMFQQHKINIKVTQYWRNYMLYSLEVWNINTIIPRPSKTWPCSSGGSALDFVSCRTFCSLHAVPSSVIYYSTHARTEKCNVFVK